jgi:hypothetical protein
MTAPRRLLGLSLALSATLFAVPATAAPPTEAPERAAAVGQPVELRVESGPVLLTGRRAVRQVLVAGRYADGSLRDLTPFAAFTCEPAGLVRIEEGGLLQPQRDGAGQLVVTAGGRSARVPVTVQGMATDQPVSFRRQVVASLNVGGCNAGACHGTPSGKNGFRLSLRGADPAADYLQLTRDVMGRRTDRNDPAASLMLQKGLGRVPHEGGQRFAAGSVPVQMLSGWLGEGLQDDPADLPPLAGIDVRTAGPRVLHAPSRWAQLAVRAGFGDKSSSDVTRLTVFTSSDSNVAEVSPAGLVEFKQPGEVAILCRYLDELQAVRLTFLEPRDAFAWSNPPEQNYIDKHVFAKLRMMSIAPSDLCSDTDYVRRAYLDVCGLLPTPAEVRAFTTDPAPDKRAKLVDRLLERPEYADFWTLKWADVLRSSRKTLQAKGAFGFQQWLHEQVAANTPFDRLTRELLTATGSTYTNPPANYFRVAKDPTSLAETTAQLFLGARMQCAKCHNHPFERWTQDDYYSLAAFFARVKSRPDPNFPAPAKTVPTAEVIYADRSGEVAQPRSGKVLPPRFPGGAVAPVAPGQDRRAALADWLTRPDNPYFARSVANRVWFHLTGRGIVDPVDDFRDSNPAANDELLDALAKDFAGNGFDVKRLIRTVMASRTYQLSAQPNATNKDDNRYFSHAVTKLLTAEQLLDALCDVTGVPEKFAGLPAGTRAIQLPDGEVNHPFLKTFGQPARELACECERESDSNLAQALQLINGPTINEKLRSPNNRLGQLLAGKKPDAEVLAELYLTALSRPPLPEESAAALEHVGKAADKRKAWEDVLWALLNTREFLFRH